MAHYYGGGMPLAQNGGDQCFKVTCGDGSWKNYTASSMSYIGAGQGDYMTADVYKYVGTGAGDYGVPQVPMQTQPTCCLWILVISAVLLMCPLIAYLYSMSSLSSVGPHTHASHVTVIQTQPTSPPMQSAGAQSVSPALPMSTTSPAPSSPSPAPTSAPAVSPSPAPTSSPAPAPESQIHGSPAGEGDGSDSDESTFDCAAGTVDTWSIRKRVHCCVYASIGCPTTPNPSTPVKPTLPPAPKEGPPASPEAFDCKAGYSNLADGWSPEKKQWCCRIKQIGCGGSEPYDCKAGYANWVKGWSSRKKQYCCTTKHLGCDAAQAAPVTITAPYDCNAAYSNWANAWSPKKKDWCCTNKHMGCSPLHSAELKAIIAR